MFVFFLRYIRKVNRKQGEPYKYLERIIKVIVFIRFFVKIHWQVFLSTYNSAPTTRHNTIIARISNPAAWSTLYESS